jgi:7-cyano-7-deazaguanine synthase
MSNSKSYLEASVSNPNGDMVLFSGGLDSTVLVERQRSMGRHVVCLFVDYGQPAAHAEWMTALRYCSNREIPLISAKNRLLGSKNQLEIGVGRAGARVVTGRNMFLIATAAMKAADWSCNRILLGCTWSDELHYPDCRPAFIKQVDDLMYATYGLSVEAPMIDMEKRSVYMLGEHLRVDLSRVWSCYEPNSRGEQCGECNACIELAACAGEEDSE